MAKTVKCGVFTKRSTVPVMQNRYLEVKINVTGVQNTFAERPYKAPVHFLFRHILSHFMPTELNRTVYWKKIYFAIRTLFVITSIIQNIYGSLLPSQIQFPALDIRLSYNNIQLFLAIVKSIPTTCSPWPSDSADDTLALVVPSMASPDPSTSQNDTFRHKTEALLGISPEAYRGVVKLSEGQLTRLQDLGFRKEH
ncbi:hypothetical protein J4Q44_G00211510 [Coregonus suidteri]|uniref:Uncharacterized protein n=1 Tax=Coregonus suidteri TaxID=861788 RepID=A0AAN8QLN5_9TELE